MRVVIEKRGDSALVRIPATVMAAASLAIDQVVEVREENGRVVIERVRAPTYALDELLSDMPENFHDNEDLAPVSQELW